MSYARNSDNKYGFISLILRQLHLLFKRRMLWKRVSFPKVVDLSGCPGEEASGKTLFLGLNFHPIPVTSEDQPLAIIEKVKEVSPEIFMSILPVGFYTWIDCCACFRIFAISMVGVGDILLAVKKRVFRSSFRFKFGSETADASQLEQCFLLVFRYHLPRIAPTPSG